MKSNQKKLSHVIRSIEDAWGFDEENDMPSYERFTGNKKQIFDDLDLLTKRKSKHRDSRRTDTYISSDF